MLIDSAAIRLCDLRVGKFITVMPVYIFAAQTDGAHHKSGNLVDCSYHTTEEAAGKASCASNVGIKRVAKRMALRLADGSCFVINDQVCVKVEGEWQN
jgi:hypothetical protein